MSDKEKKSFLEHLFYFLLGIVLIIPWVYKSIIPDREYVGGGLPGIDGLLYEFLAGIGLLFVWGILYSANESLIKYKIFYTTSHYVKKGLRVTSVLLGVFFLITGIFFIKEDHTVSFSIIFVSIPLIAIGCKLSYKIILYLFAILIILFPFFDSFSPKHSVFNFVFAAVLIWFAKSTKNKQDKLVEKVKRDEKKSHLN
tara:strand:- start:63 stop:656 length:594 start_codon:yes stop_codon:yes gene_type:complete